MYEIIVIIVLLVYVLLTATQEGSLRLGRLEPFRKYSRSVKTFFIFPIAAIIVWHQDIFETIAVLVFQLRPPPAALRYGDYLLSVLVLVWGIWLGIRYWPRSPRTDVPPR